MNTNSITVGRCRFLYDWTDWPMDIHEMPDQIVRQGRAMTYPFSFSIRKNKKSGRFSSTTDIPVYVTTLDKCNCYDFQKRNMPCKHIYRLAVELGLIEIIYRPSFDKEAVQAIRESNDIDSQPDQIKRIEKAKDKKCTPISVDVERKVGTFQGSGKKPYETTLESCTCRDFFVRRLPCKHMYRLRIELAKSEEQE